jgi:hypothetical protein
MQPGIVVLVRACLVLWLSQGMGLYLEHLWFYQDELPIRGHRYQYNGVLN